MNYIATFLSVIQQSRVLKSTSLNPHVKNQLMGEAKFMRGFCYFYLVNLFGDVPLVTTTDYKVNTTLGRTAFIDVYDLIISDLTEAQNLLSSDYLDGYLQKYPELSERVRPTKWAATALLARAYLYTKDYINAEAQSTQVINQSSLFDLPNLNDVFLKNSSEAIWQLQPVNGGKNTEDAFVFIIPESGLSDQNPVYLSLGLINEFEDNDQRKQNWIDTAFIGLDTVYYPFKYKIASYDNPISEYLMMLRLSEQYLIRADARASQGNLEGAILDLNVVRSRAGLAGTNATTQSNILNAITHERQVEFFGEWAHRWLDLKRTGKIDEVMEEVTAEKGGAWNSNWQWYPILSSDIQKNPRINQNSGY